MRAIGVFLQQHLNYTKQNRVILNKNTNLENYILKIHLHKCSLILKISLSSVCNLKVLFQLYITGEYIKLLANNGTTVELKNK